MRRERGLPPGVPPVHDDAVGLTAVEAALTGTALGSLATFSSAWYIQRATTRREHESRLWERRRGVYDEAVILMHRIGHLRDEVEETGAFPERAPGDPDPVGDMTALVARMDIYGTDELLAACERVFEALDGWNRAWGAWHTQRETNPRRSASDPRWVRFLDLVKVSREAESRAIGLLRSDVHVERPPEWWKLRERHAWRKRRRTGN
ncbi:hypothetical protein CP970_27465 [Streptomyces kanamyceticus]|uniref:Uncharacterized protein n=1 Tax=Streptomyces kanamyceticus TaxID=1967 RepID=A0A5J6GGA8_STRKN|nr:hypothetical protein CP970_27465 [Streptomyces kanamyceticus]